jgi:hypothetical protein
MKRAPLPFWEAPGHTPPAQFLCKRAEIMQARSQGAAISPRRTCVLPVGLDCAYRIVLSGVLASGVLASTLGSPAAGQEACSVPAHEGETVVLAGRTADGLLLLADGRKVRLSGLDAASLRLPDGLEGNEATLVSPGPADRHGAVRSDLLVDAVSLSQRLLAEGRARVRPAPGDAACYARLYAVERGAVRRALGLWGEPGYAMGDAADPDAVSRQRDRFAVVTGRVLHVGVAERWIFIDFGGDWKTDVTLTIRVKDRARFAEAGLAVETLEGQVIRARGVVTMRGGPMIEITEPAAIQRIAGDD